MHVESRLWRATLARVIVDRKRLVKQKSGEKLTIVRKKLSISLVIVNKRMPEHQLRTIIVIVGLFEKWEVEVYLQCGKFRKRYCRFSCFERI